MDGVGAVCCVYDDDPWIPLMVEGCYDAADRLYFLVGKYPWNGEVGSNEKTLKAITGCRDPGQKIVVIHGDWPNETVQRNAGLDICMNDRLSLCLIIDADEIYDPGQLRLMSEIAATQPHVAAWEVSLTTYWKTIEFRIDPPEPLHPPVYVKLGQARFVLNRQVRAAAIGRFPRQLGVCHHLSYARTDEQVKKKLTRFSHAHQIRPEWFEDVWRMWDLDHNLRHLHPIWPEVYGAAVSQDPQSYPPALRRLWTSTVLSA